MASETLGTTGWKPLGEGIVSVTALPVGFSGVDSIGAAGGSSCACGGS